MNTTLVNQKRQSRQNRVRRRLLTSANRPRLTVHRSNAHIYAQIIDDQKQTTLASASSQTIKSTQPVTKIEQAKAVGKELALKAKKHKLVQVAFDRGHYQYHGRVKTLADSARENGLEF